MSNRLSRFAPLGLGMAVIALLVAAGLFVVQREWNLAVQISLGVAIIGGGLFALLDPERVRRLFTGKKARHESNALILSVAFIAVVVILNYLVYQDSTQNPRRVDLTEDKFYTLAPETLAVLENLDEPVFAQAFYSSQTPTGTAEDILEQYKIYGAGNFDYEFIDPLVDQVAAEQANVAQDGTIVVTMGENKQNVDSTSEQQLTSALIKLMNPEVRAVYFLTGHGEYGLSGSEGSYSQIKRILESKNYKVDTLNLIADNKMPDDAEVVIVAAPQKPVTQDEIGIIEEYLESGKGLIVLQEPIILTDFGDLTDPLAGYLSEDWGITLGEDIIFDQTSSRPVDAVGSVWGNHQIVNNLTSYVAVFPGARSVTLNTAPAGISQAQLVSTSSQAWAETDLASLQSEEGEITFDQEADLPGPVPLGAVGENFDTDSRVVVFGDADFSTDVNFGFYANTDLFVNSVDWATGEVDQIDITPRENTARFLVPPQPVLVNFIFLVIVLIMPGLALVAGFVSWYQRKKRG